MTKQEKIDALVSNMLDTALGDTDFLCSIIRNGFKGYEEMTENEIDNEYADYIDSKEEVK